MTKRKQNGPVNVRHIATGEEWAVPRDVFSAAKAATWIEQQIAAREQEAQEASRRKFEEEQVAEAAKCAAAEAAASPELSRVEMQDRITELEHQLRKLTREVDDSNHLMKSKDRRIHELNKRTREQQLVIDSKGIDKKDIDELHSDFWNYETTENRDKKRLKERNGAYLERMRAGENIPMEAFTAPLAPEEGVE